MTYFPGRVTVLPLLPPLLVHLAGVVVAALLLVRYERSRGPTMLALFGFVLLGLTDVARFARGPLIGALVHPRAMDIRLASASVGCCFSLFEVVAVLFLIVALWQAISGLEREKAGSEPGRATPEGG